MTKQVQRRRGSSSEHTSFTGAAGEISVNTTNNTMHVHDGSTAGGFESARSDLDNVSTSDITSGISGGTVASLTITSADINGGTLDNVTVGGSTAAAGTFTNITASGTINLNGATVSDGGTVTTVDIDGGTIDGVTIGGASAGAGTFTNVTATGTINLNGATVSDGGTVTTVDIDGGSIDGATIGANSAAAGTFSSATVTGDLTVDTNTLFVDASENAIGIGTTTVTDAGVTITPSVTRAGGWDAKLALQSTGADDFPALLFSNSDTNKYGGIVGTTDTTGDVSANRTAQIAFLQTSATAGNITFSTNGDVGTTNVSERMRLDSSGNLLVSTTSDFASGTVDGIIAQGTAKPAAAFSNTANGQIVKFYQSGNLVGSIVAQGSARIAIGTGDTGLIFNQSNDSIHAWNIDANTNRTDNIDLGNGSNRFKDLYLGGSVYLGGTGSANALDDYEVGTWTPVLGGASFTQTGTTFSNARYVKIGSSVFYGFAVSFSGTSGNWSAGDGFYLSSGVPFSNSTLISAGSCWASTNWLGGVRATGIVMAYASNQAYIGIEQAGACARSVTLHCGVTFRI